MPFAASTFYDTNGRSAFASSTPSALRTSSLLSAENSYDLSTPQPAPRVAAAVGDGGDASLKITAVNSHAASSVVEGDADVRRRHPSTWLRFFPFQAPMAANVRARDRIICTRAGAFTAILALSLSLSPRTGSACRMYSRGTSLILLQQSFRRMKQPFLK